MKPMRCDSKDIRAQDLIVFTPCYGFRSSVSLCLFFFFLERYCFLVPRTRQHPIVGANLKQASRHTGLVSYKK